MGRGKLTLYSLVLQPPPLFKHYHHVIRPHTRNSCLLSAPSDHAARGVLAQDALARTPLWSTIMKPYPSANGHQDPKQAHRNNSAELALSLQVLICPPPLLGHHPMVTSPLDLSKVIIRPMKDGDGKRTFEFGPIVTTSCHRWDSNTRFASQANPAATHSRPEWHPMARAIIPRTLLNQRATYSWPKSILPTI
ncbi:hypothetical protein O181_094271 [Austropuccinia psidii MF-1]|uniref:Uncharacterized protein n=1 Tax=Austropuccinia psidii MF-1 TaxID=1389203 RepID=A0A9Q3PC91_9BASI|nr:hypothetical protein [Austropuccinia psidii MF-1]